MSLSTILKRPFPINSSWQGKLRTAIFFGLFIFLFLLIFKPFRLDSFPAGRLWWIISLYALITFSCVFLSSVIIPILAPGYFCEPAWTTARQIFFIAMVVVLVGLVNYLVSPLLFGSTLSFRDALWYQGITLLIAMLPVTLYILVRENQLLKTFREQAGILEKKLQEKNELQKLQAEKKEEEKKTTGIIILEGDYQDERIEIASQRLYMVQSANNYIKVYAEQKGKVSYSIIRLTMKKAEDLLTANGAFFRCHRMYIINLDKIVHVQGNAQGYKAIIEGIDEPVPISRNLNTEFSDRLLAIRKEIL